MAKARKFLLLHERRETWRLRLGKGRREHCPECCEIVNWLSASEAARISRLSERALFRLVENRGVHFAESKDGILLICLPSLEGAVRSGPERA